MKLVFIHGRDQQGKDHVALQKVWEEALYVGLERAGLHKPTNMTVAFPFYGDELDRLVKQLDAPLVNDVTTKGAAPDDHEAAFRGQLLADMAKSAGVSDAEIAAAGNVTVQEKGPLNWEWVQAILRALDKSPMGDPALDRFTRDVYVYLTYDAVSKKVDKIVSDLLDGQPCVIVAHSLGTIVAYRVLSALAGNVDVRGFVTLGSPLGLTTVRNHLTPPLVMPAGVKSWLNAFDPRDVVALQPLDATTWNIKPPIENQGDVDNYTNNRHGISGYLDDAKVARWIASLLTT